MKTKTFIQHKEDCFKINIVIKNNGNIRTSCIVFMNTDKQKEYYKQYRKRNKEKITKNNKEYY